MGKDSVKPLELATSLRFVFQRWQSYRGSQRTLSPIPSPPFPYLYKPPPFLHHLLLPPTSSTTLFPPKPHFTELAIDIEGSPEKDSSSTLTSDTVSVVHALYDALRSRDADTVHHLLAEDLEWWFHGPPSHQHLMRLLTGSSDEQGKLHSFAFVPETVVSFGPLVIAEGCNKGCSVFWVHAWTVSDEGVITRVREYFNTSLTVTRFGGPEPSSEIDVNPYRDSIWESSLSSDQIGKSVPGLVLAL